jgi:hypothetical protein
MNTTHRQSEANPCMDTVTLEICKLTKKEKETGSAIEAEAQRLLKIMSEVSPTATRDKHDAARRALHDNPSAENLKALDELGSVNEMLQRNQHAEQAIVDNLLKKSVEGWAWFRPIGQRVLESWRAYRDRKFEEEKATADFLKIDYRPSQTIEALDSKIRIFEMQLAAPCTSLCGPATWLAQVGLSF